MKGTTAREIKLKRWPAGLPAADDFEIAEMPLPDLTEGRILVRNLFMSVDPYMRGRLRPGKSYVSSFALGSTLDGGCVGVVEKSMAASVEPGTYVLSGRGFRDRFVADAGEVKVIDPGSYPVSAYLGVLGMPGRTAYVGLLEIGKPVPGETVYISGAAGAVGSAACQIAKILGCRVVGSAGSAEKVRWLTDVAGVDGAFNYKDYGNLGRELRRRCPDGIDVYFDNVGGDHLEAAIASMNNFGRIVACGMISRYNDTESVPGPSNLMQIVGKRLRIQGFIVSDHEAADFDSDMKKWIAEGKVRWEETVVEGLDRAVDALIGLFTGVNMGKMVVKLDT